MCLAVQIQRSPAGVVVVTAPQAKHAAPGAETPAADVQVKAPQQRESAADEILGFLYGISRGWYQGGQPFEQSRLACIQVLGSSALVDAPVPSVGGAEVLAAARRKVFHPRNVIEGFARHDQ